MSNLPYRWINGALRQENPLDEGPELPPPDYDHDAELSTLRARAETAEARVKALEEENKALRADLPFVIGWNDGFEHALTETTNWQFPTILRKMWSGSEVQKWIDERKAEARAALEAK